MKKEEIKAWFDGNRDYNEGVELFQKFASNKSLLRFFSRGISAASTGKLVWELHKIAGLPESICYAGIVTSSGSTERKIKPRDLHKRPEAPAIIKSEPAKKVIAYADLPTIIKKMITEKGEKIRERAVCHKEMGDITGNTPKENKKRETLRNTIKTCTDRINELTDAIALYDSKKIIPEEKTESIKDKAIDQQNEIKETEDKAELLQKRSNLRSRVSKAKAKVLEAKGQKKKDAQEKLTTLEQELTEIENKLK